MESRFRLSDFRIKVFLPQHLSQPNLQNRVGDEVLTFSFSGIVTKKALMKKTDCGSAYTK